MPERADTGAMPMTPAASVGVSPRPTRWKSRTPSSASSRRTCSDSEGCAMCSSSAAAENDPKLKGVMNMKFMRDARARASREVEQDADELRRKLDQMDKAAEQSEDEEPMALAQQVQGNLGRMVFGPSSTLAQVRFDSSSCFIVDHFLMLCWRAADRST